MSKTTREEELLREIEHLKRQIPGYKPITRTTDELLQEIEILKRHIPGYKPITRTTDELLQEIEILKRHIPKPPTITCQFCNMEFTKAFNNNHTCKALVITTYEKVCNSCGKKWGNGDYCAGGCGAYDGYWSD